MSTPVQIKGGGANGGVLACVTSIGQLVVAPLSYDESEFNELAEPDTAYNFYKPKPGQQFVVTGIVARADKQVSNTVDATVVVYAATSDTATTISETILQLAMVRDDIISPLPLNIIVKPGRFVNAKTTDDDVHMTVFGYFVPKL